MNFSAMAQCNGCESHCSHLLVVAVLICWWSQLAVELPLLSQLTELVQKRRSRLVAVATLSELIISHGHDHGDTDYSAEVTPILW